MQLERHLNDTEVGELLAGEGIDEATRHVARCTACSSEVTELATLRDALRGELSGAADRPEHFWIRQRARMRERLTQQRPCLRWPIAAMAALAVLSFGLSSIKTPAPAPARAVQTVDADDLLLRDIQHSLAHRAPEPLMPASVLLQEMTIDSRKHEKREN
ncbi:MAG TPA: hypothetical protein VMS96_10890 [Terriglobales bacterium]|nr:hypothetical protein [Terriglobales bacterium]